MATTSKSSTALHPVTLTTFAPTGCELSTWGYITRPRPSDHNDGGAKSNGSSFDAIPNLITAHANSLRIYVVDPIGGTLILAASYDNLAGTIVSLFTLPRAAGQSNSQFAYDGLLVGFAGNPRLSIVYPPGGISDPSISSSCHDDWSGVLTASSIIDLTPALSEKSLGSVTPLEQDLVATVTDDGKVPTVAVILGGGVAIATFQLPRSSRDKHNNWWRTASEPYLLPLEHLSTHIPFSRSSGSSALSNKYSRQPAPSSIGLSVSNKISHGFGDILSCAFLQGYTEPVLAVLHSNPHLYGGRSCTGRLGHMTSHTRSPMSLTAISISNVQKRSVVLWSCADAMPADAFEIVPHPKGGVLVVGINEILYVDCAGSIKCCTAVNGWVRATGSAALMPKHGHLGGIMQPNPSPLPKLNLQLDGCRISFVNQNVAMMALRDGALYSLELHEREECIGVGGNADEVCMSLASVGTKLGAIGEVASLSALSLAHIPVMTNTWSKFIDKTTKSEDDVLVGKETVTSEPISLGLIYAGSRMGDSTLFLYGLKEKVQLSPLERDGVKDNVMTEGVKSSEKLKRKREDENDEPRTSNEQQTVKTEGSETFDRGRMNAISDDDTNLSEEEILRREEEALYALSDDENSNGIEISGVKEQETLLPGISSKQLYRPQIKTMSLFQDIVVLDSLTGLGPIGPGTIGATPGKDMKDASTFPLDPSKQSAGKSFECVYPCGYGNSGGLAVMTVPGLHCGSTIVNEVDCLNMGSIFSCPQFGYFFILKKENDVGCMIMKIEKSDTGNALVELDITSLLEVEDDQVMDGSIPSFDNARDVLTRMNLISVKEFTSSEAPNKRTEKFIALVVQYGSAYAIVVLSETKKGKLTIAFSHFIGSEDEGIMISRENLVSVSFLEHLDQSRSHQMVEDISIGCVWSTGCASVFSIQMSSKDMKSKIKEVFFKSEDDIPSEENGDFNPFYGSRAIKSVDVFTIADSIFDSNRADHLDEIMKQKHESIIDDDIFDEDDLDLYGIDSVKASDICNVDHEQDGSGNMIPSRYNTLGGYISGSALSETSKMVVAVCRQNGALELYDASKLFSSTDDPITVLSSTDEHAALIWKTSSGCGQGATVLISERSVTRYPKVQESCSVEIKFFFCGPSLTGNPEFDDGKDLSILRSLCLIVQTNQGDLHLYIGSKTNERGTVAFKRIPFHAVHRKSKDEAKHHAKLLRKKIASEDRIDSVFRANQLHRFSAISGEDGLFVATSRPLWIVSERGAPTYLYHRLRHCAPAGGSNLPMAGFCTGFIMSEDTLNTGFLTIHERIGRVGTQRLTLFNGLSDIFSTHGLLPGSGVSMQKIPLGVTVRKIDYIDDPLVSSQSHPIYALLISREIEEVQSIFNNDGLTEEERTAIKEEKERKLLQKQVEADLGGFEVDQEWVEEIERDNCFEVEKRYGGAPSMPKSVFEVWLIDASTWNILDTYQLGENEYGMTMKYVTLSDISPEEEKVEDHEDFTYLAVGTAQVDADGEDLESKGRILLFELKRIGDQKDAHEIEMSFLYEKEISVGPVTSITQLTTEGKGRLVVGAGAEITVEQWGVGKLTQVGFFHAHMQVQDIVMFKNFFLLSDAYDSVHFLVWRESDKSLTLLAKDYEPVSCYATGLISRGSSMSFVVHDDRQNLTFLSYAPLDPAARGGNKLVCRADCHLGTSTVGLQNHLCRSSLIINSATTQSTLAALKQQDPLYGKADDDQRFGLHYGSTDSSFGTIIPVNESIYWRLAALQSVMSNALESHCSLSHRAWRLYRRTPRRGGCRSNDRKKGVIDGDLVLQFIDLPIAEQEDLASAIGSTVDLILDNLLEVGASSMIL